MTFSPIQLVFPRLAKSSFVPRIEVSPTAFFLILFVLGAGPILLFVLFDYSVSREQKFQPRGCRKLGLRMRSHLADQHHLKYALPSKDGSIKVKSLWIYPVKSCRGVELNRGTVIETGMLYDRQFSFAQLEKSAVRGIDEKPNSFWKFVTQRQYPLLAKVRTEMWIPDPASPTYSPAASEVQSGGVIVIKFPYVPAGWKGTVSKIVHMLGGAAPEKTFRVPFIPTAEEIERQGYRKEKMIIWKDNADAINLTSLVPPELKKFLGVEKPFALFRIDGDHLREVFRCAPRKEELGYQSVTGFQDAYPLHIVNLASLHDVAKRLESPIKLSALRFRPNIIVTGPKAYDEDSWKKIKIGDHVYYCSCRTARCKMPNVDPDTAERDRVDPDKTLRSFRCIDEGAGKNACLGMQMVPADHESPIKVDDDVDILERGEHYYIKQ